MSDPQIAGAQSPFTPSELVVLCGDRFAAEGGVFASYEEVLTTGVKVSAGQLAHAAMAAAVLANEQAGAVRLELHQGKALFGLMKTEKLHLVPGTRTVTWPEGSLEVAVAQGAARQPEIGELFQGILEKKTQSPAQDLAVMIKAGLAYRGLLHVEAKQVLLVFTTARFLLPDSTRAALAAAPVATVRELLRACERENPELWARMVKGFRSAITRMTDGGG